MKADFEIQKHVMEELQTNPLLKANEIDVAVKNGIVTLSGIIDSYPKKIAAEKTVKKVKGVKGIAQELEVLIPDHRKKTDSEIAQAVLHALEWYSAINIDKIKITIEDAAVTLEGEAEWDYQRQSAKKVTQNINGVRDVICNIKISAQPEAGDIKEKIKKAFLRNAIIDANNIIINTEGNRVLLTGKVNNWSESLEAESCVWSSPGVSKIENKLEIDEEL